MKGDEEKGDNDKSVQDNFLVSDGAFLVMYDFCNGHDDVKNCKKHKKYPTQHCNISFIFLFTIKPQNTFCYGTDWTLVGW